MGKRKNICLVTNMPTEFHGQHICDGVFAQCRKYGYNVAVFAMMSEFELFYKDLLEGEKIIYNLPDFSRFDGIVIDSVSFLVKESRPIAEDMYARIRESGVPSVCISSPVEGIPTIENSNDEALRTICRHITDVHKCRKICILTGPKGNPESENRLRIWLEELEKCGIAVPEEYRIYGDFWYTSGEKLAEDIVNGRIERPEAVLAASDHMALGVIQKLTELGMRVPEDVIVAGFDLTDQGMLDTIPLTSISSNFAECAANAVDHLKDRIDPEWETVPYVPDYNDMLHIGKSCGCEYSVNKVMRTIQPMMYRTHPNFSRFGTEGFIDIGLLMENYIFEGLTGSESPEKCIENIFGSTYLLDPYQEFALCLREDWLEKEMDSGNGLPKQMKMVLRRMDTGEGFYTKENAVTFDTSLMFPPMFEEREEPFAYYFSPVHFGKNCFGYTVLCRKMQHFRQFNLVYRTWFRFVCCALEMSRARNALSELSVRDKMTGLYNRRGMSVALAEMQNNAGGEDRLYVSVIDMNGLKRINDTYGHNEGDHSIIRLSEAVKAFAGPEEICIRAGGDEFFILGMGEYGHFDEAAATERFRRILKECTEKDHKEYTITASIGFAISEKGGHRDFKTILSRADEQMYRMKRGRE